MALHCPTSENRELKLKIPIGLRLLIAFLKPLMDQKVVKGTAQQQLAQAIRAHKDADLAEAERCYAAVLTEDPLHPQANHGLGAVAAALGQFGTAISYFSLALKAQPETEEYWASLIDGLIRHGDFDAARLTFETGRRNGVIVENLSGLESRLHGQVYGDVALDTYGSIAVTDPEAQLKFSHSGDEGHLRRLSSRMEALYQDSTEIAIEAASPGWLFADSFDRLFMSEIPFKGAAGVNNGVAERVSNSARGSCRLSQVDPLQAIDELKSVSSIVQKYQLLGQLITAERGNITEGSFSESPGLDLSGAARATFKNGALNVLIIGGGPCGLYLASGLKASSRAQVNVLVADNRAIEPNVREPFNRKWLTQISSQLFVDPAYDEIFTLLGCFGTDGRLGLPINFLEGILQLFCKAVGVRFFFSPEMDYTSLAHQRINLMFDATGGRLPTGTYKSNDGDEYNARVPTADIGFVDSGVSQLFNKRGAAPEFIDFTLKKVGDFFYPHSEEISINYHMLKLTGVPLDILAEARGAIEKSNAGNTFFFWRGCLREEINEGLIFANLTTTEARYLWSAITEPVELASLLSGSPNLAASLGEVLLSMLHLLAKKDLRRSIKMEPVFHYRPGINLSAGSGYFHGNRIYPIGDSLFNGHPKMGNGLSNHLSFIAKLHRQILQSVGRLDGDSA